MQKKISVDELQIGMYVSALDCPWEETSFLFQGFPINHLGELEELRRLCKHVFIETERMPEVREGLQTLRPVPKSKARVGISSPTPRGPKKKDDEGHDQTRFVAELEQARGIFDDAKNYIDSALEDVRLGRSVDTASARRKVSEMVSSVMRNASALMLMTNLKNRDEYTSIHCVNVSILSVAFGRYLGLGADELADLGLGALLHDIGKMRVPLEILNKPGRLSAEEFETIKKHVIHGYKMLDKVDGLPPRALDIVLSHHERIDGSGYPRGLSGEGIGQFAMMVALVDVYDAVTSDRVYHSAISPHDALSMMYDHTPVTFEKGLFEQFIKCLGIFPIGSLVELSSGQVGMVMTVNRKRHLKPIVMLLLAPDKRPYRVRKMVNLALQGEGEELYIKRILESSAYEINVREILKNEAFA